MIFLPVRQVWAVRIGDKVNEERQAPHRCRALAIASDTDSCAEQAELHASRQGHTHYPANRNKELDCK